MTYARRILADVSLIHGVRIAALLRRCGTAAVRRARWEAMYRMRTEHRLSLPCIGRALGGMHHTSVLYGLRRFEELLDTEEGLAERLAPAAAAQKGGA